MANNALAVSIIGLIVVIVTHIVVIARWSGQVDGYIRANNERLSAMDIEIKRLRDARHEADGRIQLHDGALREVQRVLARRWAEETKP